MENCLITKLKSAVNDTSLLKIGEMIIKVKKNSNINNYTQQLIELSAVDDYVYIEVSGTGYFVTNNYSDLDIPEKRKTQIEIRPEYGTITLYFANEDYEIHIQNKYCIKEIYIGEDRKMGSILDMNSYSIFELNIEDFKYNHNLNALNIRFSNTYGDIRQLNKYPLHSIKLTATNVVGDYSELITTYITHINSPSQILNDLNTFNNAINIIEIMGNSGCGDISDFVIKQRANGRTIVPTSSPIYFYGFVNKLSFGSQQIKNVPYHAAFLTWDETKIVLYGGDYSNYQNATMIYAQGATAEEISAWEADGKTVIVVD